MRRIIPSIMHAVSFPAPLPQERLLSPRWVRHVCHLSPLYIIITILMSTAGILEKWINMNIGPPENGMFVVAVSSDESLAHHAISTDSYVPVATWFN